MGFGAGRRGQGRLPARRRRPRAAIDSMTSLEDVRDRFAGHPVLPFADILPEAEVRDALAEHRVGRRDRVFTPATTLWGFLSQVLSDDHSCRDAVARVLAHRTAGGLPA